MISISSYDFYQIRPVPSRMKIHLNGANEHFQDLNSKFAPDSLPEMNLNEN